MSPEDARKAAEVMLAYADGAEIEVIVPNPFRKPNSWVTVSPETFHGFNFSFCDYRTKKTPDSINWDHVAPEYKWMARSEKGSVYLFKEKPITGSEPLGGNFCSGPRFGNWFWAYNQKGTPADTHFSYKRGTVDWKDSLVERPSGEGSA